MDPKELETLASEMASPIGGVEIKTRKYLLRSYPDCFIGSEGVEWIAKARNCSKQTALMYGNELMKAGYLVHTVDKDKPFLDGYYFYIFTNKTKKKKAKLKKEAVPKTLKESALLMRAPGSGVEIKNRKYHLKTYKNCFVASEGVDWLMTNMGFRNREEAVEYGEKLVLAGFIEHVVEPQPFRDAFLFFRFTRYTNSDSSNIAAQEIVGIDDFEQLSIIGEGGYGKVSTVRKKDTGKVYAMKTIQKSRITSEKALEHILTERNVLINDSPFLLHLHYSFQTPTKLCLVTDFLGGGDLFFHLAKKKGLGFSPKVCKFFTAELVLALEHLHQCGVIYRDLKLENVLLDDDGHICLADFGLSKLLDDSDRTKTFCGSQGYLAPEILRGEKYSYPVDWFSLGVIVYEMMTGTNPFLASSFIETCKNILHKKVHYPPDIFVNNSGDFVEILLARDVDRRFQTAAEIKRHAWFKGLDWNKVAYKKFSPPFSINLRSKESTENFDEAYTKLDIDSELIETTDNNNAFEGFDYVGSVSNTIG